MLVVVVPPPFPPAAINPPPTLAHTPCRTCRVLLLLGMAWRKRWWVELSRGGMHAARHIASVPGSPHAGGGEGGQGLGGGDQAGRTLHHLTEGLGGVHSRWRGAWRGRWLVRRQLLHLCVHPDGPWRHGWRTTRIVYKHESILQIDLYGMKYGYILAPRTSVISKSVELSLVLKKSGNRSWPVYFSCSPNVSSL